MSAVKLVWITPEAEKLIVHMARVSSPISQAEGANPERLLRYLIKHKHWSPFEMASACFEIETTRDIARQILRHRSMHFQEFSQRYAATETLPVAPLRRARLQDEKNRQASREVEDADLHGWWEEAQSAVVDLATGLYGQALNRGVAKEVARAVLPEGLTTSRLYAAAPIRTWLHYLQVRGHPSTQVEHREVAMAIWRLLVVQLPIVLSVFQVADEPPVSEGGP